MRGGHGAELSFTGPNGPGRELFLGGEGTAILLMFLLVVNATFGIR